MWYFSFTRDAMSDHFWLCVLLSFCNVHKNDYFIWWVFNLIMKLMIHRLLLALFICFMSADCDISYLKVMVIFTLWNEKKRNHLFCQRLINPSLWHTCQTLYSQRVNNYCSNGTVQNVWLFIIASLSLHIDYSLHLWYIQCMIIHWIAKCMISHCIKKVYPY